MHVTNWCPIIYKKSDKIVTYTLTKTIGMLYLPLIVIFSC